MSDIKKIVFKILKLSIGKKTILGVLILTVVLSAVSIMIGSALQRDGRIRNYEEDTWKLARTVAILLDGANAPEIFEQVHTIREQIPDDLYTEIDKCWHDLENAGEETDSEALLRTSERYSQLLQEYRAYF